MKLVVNKEQLLEGLRIVSQFADPSNKNLAILSSVCLKLNVDKDYLTLCTTNLSSIGVARVMVSYLSDWALHEMEGVCVPCKQIIDTLAALPAELLEVVIETVTGGETGNKITIQDPEKSKKYTLSTTVSDFDYIKKDAFTEVITLPASVFRSIMAMTMPFASDDTLKIAMCSVFVEMIDSDNHLEFLATATDAHTLKHSYILLKPDAVTTFKCNETGVHSLHLDINGLTGVVNDLKKAMNSSLKIEVANNGYRFFFVTDTGIHCSVAIQRIDAKFPDYVNVMPNPDRGMITKIICNRQELLKSAKRMLIYADKVSYLCKLTIDHSNSTLLMESESISLTEQAKENISVFIPYAKEQVTSDPPFGLNIKLLQRLLNSMDCEEVAIHYFGANKAFLITDARDDSEAIDVVIKSKGILMPIMLGF